MRTRLALAALAAVLTGWLGWEAVSAADGPNFATWESYLGGADSTQYSSLKQIDKTNVASYKSPGPIRAAWGLMNTIRW